MNDKKIRKLVLAALLAALVCSGDDGRADPLSGMQGPCGTRATLLLCCCPGWLLAPWYGFCGGRHRLDAGRHSFLGYAHYALRAPWSSGGVMALVAALMCEK
ncbi:MAG: hypothetical protein ACLRSD_05860 [Oscillibacter sp.]